MHPPAADPSTVAFNVWKVTEKTNMPIANRISSATIADVLLACSSPAATPGCTDNLLYTTPDPPPGVFYYQVRGICANSTEGP